MLSFEETGAEIPIVPGGTPCVTEWGVLGRVLKAATLREMAAEGWDIADVLEEGYSPDTRLYMKEYGKAKTSLL